MKLKDSIVINCVSYTAVMIIISLLNSISISGLSWVFNLQLFVVTTIISLLIYFIEKLNIDSQPIYMLLQILSVAVSVLGVGGGIMKWFAWSFKSVSITTAVFVITYLITYSIIFLLNSITSEKINKKISEQNDEKN
ncbi:DUF3021 family protein [Intestinibacter sp.]